MITEAVLNAFAFALRALLNGVWTLIPKPPAWMITHLDDLGTFWGYVHAFDTWIPVTLAFSVAGGVVASYVAGWVIGVVRVVVSYLTFGGGAT